MTSSRPSGRSKQAGVGGGSRSIRAAPYRTEWKIPTFHYCPYCDKFAITSGSNPDLTYRPIAIASSTFKEQHGAPRQPGTEGNLGEELGSFRLLLDELRGYDVARAMLDDLDEFSHVVILGHLHLNTGWNPRVTPPRLRHLTGNDKSGKSRRKKGLLATRAPHRPNPIGMSVLKLHSIEYSYTIPVGTDGIPLGWR